MSTWQPDTDTLLGTLDCEADRWQIKTCKRGEKSVQKLDKEKGICHPCARCPLPRSVHKENTSYR